MAATALVALSACEPVPAGIPVPTIPVSTPPPTTVPTGGSWTLVGGDEFNDTTVDAAKWKPYYNT